MAKVYKKTQSIIEFSLIVAVMVGTALIMQNYLKRSMQGQIQVTTDQLGEQYETGWTKLHEYFYSYAVTKGWMTPGPRDKFTTDGLFRSNAHRETFLR
jgi:hypothetical protein